MEVTAYNTLSLIMQDKLPEALQAINQNPLAVTTKPFDTRRGEQVIPKPEMAAAQAQK